MNDNASLEQELVTSLIRDRRSDRRWRNIRFFSFIFLIGAFVFYLNYTPSHAHNSNAKKSYVSLVTMYGPIFSDKAFSAEQVIPELHNAFKDKDSKGVVLVIDSPGGSPVQASIIHDKIMQLKQKYHKKVIVLGGDALASGAYLVATAADKIYVHTDTLTGSIGVIMDGFGFNDLMTKLGVSRRVFTAGDHKDRLDPFEPLNPQDVAKVKAVLEDVHQSFIQDVVDGRQGKLKGTPDELFSGDFWTGRQATTLGLADGTGNLWTIMDAEFKTNMYRDYTTKPNLIDVLVKGISTSFNLHFGLKQSTSPVREEAF